MELRFLNHEENPVSVENISVIELFGDSTEPYLRLDDCYDANIVETLKNNVNSSPISGSRTQGSYPSKRLQFVIYTNPTNMKRSGDDVRFPLAILPKEPIRINATFAVDAAEKNRPPQNFFAVCPSIKLFDTRGQESVSVCPGMIEMTFSKEEYAADSYRVAGLIAQHEKHLDTTAPPQGAIAPSKESDVYRVIAQRAGWFQLTPQMTANSCPLIAR